MSGHLSANAWLAPNCRRPLGNSPHPLSHSSLPCRQPGALIRGQRLGSEVLGGKGRGCGGSSCVSSRLSRLSQAFLPSPHEADLSCWFRHFAVKANGVFVRNEQTRPGKKRQFPHDPGCVCLPRMPESAWQGRVCLLSGAAPCYCRLLRDTGSGLFLNICPPLSVPSSLCCGQRRSSWSRCS